MGGTARSAGSTVTIPSALAVPSSQLVFSEVSYPYTPTVGYTITGTLTLSDHMYMTPAHLAADLQRHCLHLTRTRTSDRLYTVIGSAVVDLIRSMAKREVTFFSGTVAISFL